jgi:trk system potassium uptake protein
MKLCVIGLGRFGYELAVSLAGLGHEVLAIDKNEDLVESIKDDITQAISLNVEDEDSLHEIGIDEVDTAIVAVGEDFAQSVLITALLKKLNVPNVIARATNQMHESILKLVGASKVLVLEREMAIKLAHKLSMPLGELINITADFATTQIKAPKPFIGKSIKEITKQKDRKVACIAVKKGLKLVLVNPDYIILESDSLVFAGDRKSLSTLMQM